VNQANKESDIVRALPLIKAQAFGNDFLLLDETHTGGIADLPALARRACDRHRGIGADGLMLMAPTAEGAATRLLNADGGWAEVSGNGVRCAAAWLAHERGLAAGGRLTIGTVAGPKRLELLAVDSLRYTFRAEMGPPADVREATIDLGGEPIRCVVMRVGNPQCVVLGPVTDARLRAIAGPLAVHPFFPEGTNVELATVEAPDRVRILIWERGVGPTEASGTGACAAAVAAAFAGGAGREVDVVSPGGTQRVAWTPETLWLTGWAAVVFRAEWWVD
jgi:diaminopimelate epimerase